MLLVYENRHLAKEFEKKTRVGQRPMAHPKSYNLKFSKPNWTGESGLNW